MKEKITVYVDYIVERKEIKNFICNLENHYFIEIKPTNSGGNVEKIFNFLVELFITERRPFLEKLKMKVRKINSKNIFSDYIRFLFLFCNSFSVGFLKNKNFVFFLKKTNSINKINIFFSIPKSRYLLLKASKSDSKNYLYLYSWDHYLKDKNLNYPNFKYFVWNQKCKDELVSVHKIDHNRVCIIGSTLLAYLKGNLFSEDKFKYRVLVHNSWADIDFIEWELLLIKNLVNLNYSVTYRLYPNLSEEQIEYINAKLFEVKNSVEIESSDINKLRSINSAKYIIHSGSTIGIESAILNTNTIFFQPNYSLSGKVFFKQIKYHNNLRHLESFVKLDDVCIINNFENLNEILAKSKNNIKYQNNIINTFPVYSLEEICQNIFEIISNDNKI